jgi:hypothetical protein
MRPQATRPEIALGLLVLAASKATGSLGKAYGCLKTLWRLLVSNRFCAALEVLSWHVFDSFRLSWLRGEKAERRLCYGAAILFRQLIFVFFSACSSYKRSGNAKLL